MKKLSIILIIFLLVALGIGCYVLLQEEHLNVVYGAKKSSLEERIDWEYSGVYIPEDSEIPGIPLKFKYEKDQEDDDIYIEIRATNGRFVKRKPQYDLNEEQEIVFCGKSYSFKEEGGIFWNPDIEGNGEAKSDIIEITILNDKKVIGYELVHMKLNNEKNISYEVEVILSVEFPKVNGEYQHITKNKIEKLKDKVMKEQSVVIEN